MMSLPLPLFALVLIGSVFALSWPTLPPYKPAKRDFRFAKDNLEKIGLGVRNCYGRDERFPDDIKDKGGKPLLSWRVELLPYIGEAELYSEFKLDEPWDGEHNKPLIARIPKVLTPVRGKANRGETFYQRFVGKDAIFHEQRAPLKIDDIIDGTSNTLLVVEAGEPVIWTKPADLPFDAKKPLPALGGIFKGDFHVLYCDGSLDFFRKDYDAGELKKVIMPRDSSLVDLNKLQKDSSCVAVNR